MDSNVPGWEPVEDRTYGKLVRASGSRETYLPTTPSPPPSLRKVVMRQPRYPHQCESDTLVIPNPSVNLNVEFPLQKIISPKKQLFIDEEEYDIDEYCPIEDPRNPFHKDYLKLKELGDGFISRRAGTFSQKHPKTIRQNAPDNQYSMHGRSSSRGVSPNQRANIEPLIISRKSINGVSKTCASSNSIKSYQLPHVKRHNLKENLPLDEYNYCSKCDLAYQRKPNLREQTHTPFN